MSKLQDKADERALELEAAMAQLHGNAKAERVAFYQKKNDKYKPTKAQERAVLEFAIKNKCIVTPLGWHFALEAYNEYGHCVCDPQRPACPCEQAPQEIIEKGHCRCSLFWKDYETYMKAKNLISGVECGR